ncbi:MAG: hypothetical protein HOO93_15155 [Methyloglobulus sp.]|nr:hypothetical protein [Methyloglobulus sp.]
MLHDFGQKPLGFIKITTNGFCLFITTYRVNSVKNIDLTKSVFAALLLVSGMVSAEDKYPASDFQPKVVFQDEEAAKQAESSASAKSSASSASRSSSTADPQYPAANFEPKVLYSDSDYKHTASTPRSASSSSISSGASSGETAAMPAAQKEDSSVGYLLGLIVLGIAGFVLFKKGAGIGATTKSSRSYSAVKAAGGLTGVARYMLKTSGTGVSRYLEKNAKVAPSASGAATGVAKYLASQVSSPKSTASQAATGVEKYMRNKKG